MVNILGLSGSPRNGGTEYAVLESLREAQATGGVETTFVTLRGKDIRPCLHCDHCVRHGSCIHNDDAAGVIDAMFGADGIVIGSPVYDMGISGQLACLFNRFRSRDRELCADPRPFASKVGGAIACGGSRNGGQEMAVNTILNFCLTQGMIAVGAGCWENAGGYVFSNDLGKWDEDHDPPGTAGARHVGQRVARLARILEANPTGMVLR